MAASSVSATALRTAKRALRSEVGSVLKALSPDSILLHSEKITQHLRGLPELEASKAVFTFLSMPDEVQTAATVAWLFASRKRVFVPKVMGKRSMAVLEVGTETELSGFERNSWGIPEPPSPRLSPAAGSGGAKVLTKVDADDPSLDWSRVCGEASHAVVTEGASGAIGAVLVPGMAFDSRGRRCGHGRGYYDTFLERITAQYAALGLPNPWLIAVCFDEQFQADPVPVDAHDCAMDIVVTPTRVIRASERAQATAAVSGAAKTA